MCQQLPRDVILSPTRVGGQYGKTTVKSIYNTNQFEYTQ